MTDNTPTLHHLDNSQSQRILWLLEELEIPYNLVHHTRNPATHPTAPYLAPTSLKSISQFGKAPLLITGTKDNSRSIPESLAIITYLLRTFDHEDKFILKSGDCIRDEILCSHIASNIGSQSAITMMLEMQILGIAKYGSFLEGASYRKVLTELEVMLKEGPEGGFLGGQHLSRADILLEFPLASASQRERVDLEKEFPALNDWQQKIYARPAWKRSIEKGNGYDLTVFPKLPYEHC